MPVAIEVFRKKDGPSTVYTRQDTTELWRLVKFMFLSLDTGAILWFEKCSGLFLRSLLHSILLIQKEVNMNVCFLGYPASLRTATARWCTLVRASTMHRWL